MKKRILSIVLLVSMLFSLLPAIKQPVRAAINSGTCGDGLTWTYDSGTLTISGTGSMPEDAAFTAPWAEHASSIQSIVIRDGVTGIGNSAFEGCSRLTGVTLPDSIVTIGDYAFMGCSSLSAIALPESLMSIGAFAFVDCSSLSGVTIPAGVTTISEYAFYNCNHLDSVTIPEGVTVIGDNAFAYCSSLMNVTIPGTLIHVGEDAFDHCSRLSRFDVAEENAVYSSDTAGILFNKNKTALLHCPGGYAGGYSVPGSVTSIGASAFADCGGLTGIEIPSSVKAIGSAAFSGCSRLNSVAIPGSIASIGDYTFYNCDCLVSVTISNGVTSIGSSAFTGCGSLASITIPSSVSSIGSSAFSRCNNLLAIAILNESCTIAKARDTLGSYANTVIYAYSDSTAESYAQSCGYEFMALSDSLCENGTHCYVNGICLLCKDNQILTGSCGTDAQWVLDIAGGILTITGSGETFHYSEFFVPWYDYRFIIKKVIIQEGITNIGNCMFIWHDSLIDIAIPGSVTHIGVDAFFGCSSLKEIRVAEENTVYSSDSTGILFDKEKATLILCPNGFMGEYSIPESVSAIERSAFEYCTGLTSITIPEAVSSIGTDAFSDCSNLGGIWVAEGNEAYCNDARGVLYDIHRTLLICCPNGLTDQYRIPDGVAIIGENAFSGCDNLTAVTIPNGVERIGDSAFAFCIGLTNITIPGSVTDIGHSAFSWCNLLTHVHFLGNKPSIADNAFTSCSPNLTLCYVEGSRGWDECPFPCAPWNYSRTSDCVCFQYACKDCGEVYSYVSEDAHTWQLVEEAYVAPSCLETGSNQYRCTVCGREKTEAVEPLGHAAGELLSETFMYREYTCLQCSKIFRILKDERYLAMELKDVEVCFSEGDAYGWNLSEHDITAGATALISSNQDVDSSSSETTVFFTAQQNFVLRFSYLVSSEDFFDTMTVLLDDSMILTISGNKGGNYHSPELTSGTHTLTLCYTKDTVARAGTDTGYIYNIAAETLGCSHSSLQYNPIVPAGCTEPGTIAYWYCGDCGICFADVEANTELPAEALEIPATGHNYQYTDKGDTHTAVCAACEHSYEEVHSYVDGLCICNAQDTLLDTAVKINHTLSLVNDITLNYAVSKTLLDSYDSFYMECTVPVFLGEAGTVEQIMKLQPVLNGNFYYFTLASLTAVQMNDIIIATVHMTKDGRQYISGTDTYSIATYAYSQMDKAGVNPELKTLCADLLRYGAMAQTYKGYRTDALADSSMTELHRSYLTDLSTVGFNNHNEVLGDVSNPEITWAGKILNLESRVVLRYVVDVSAYDGNVEDLALRLSYTDLNGVLVSKELRSPEIYNEEKNWYIFDFAELTAAELRCVLSASVYEGDRQVSATLKYSVDTYCNNKTGVLGDLCKTLIAYSDSARAFFT